jgi:hypothetical protein
VAWPGPGGPGYVNLHWKRAPRDGKAVHGMPGRAYKEIHEFLEQAQYAAANPHVFQDIYFCLSTQKKAGKLYKGRLNAERGAADGYVEALKSVWIDADAKHYGGKLPLLDAFDKFRAAANLPPPTALVDSGNGFHIYWISDKPMTKAEWHPYATGLWALTQQHGFTCDNVTTDAARVLRVPGTANRKDPAKPKTVRLMGTPGDPLPPLLDFDKALAHVAAKGVALKVTAAVTAAPLPGVAPFDTSMFDGLTPHPALAGLDPLGDNLSDGIGTSDGRPLDFFNSPDLLKCGHFQDLAQNKGKGHPQGLWALTVLASTFFENGKDLAWQFSKGYKGDNRDEVDAKYDEKLTYKAQRDLGWPSCKSFQNEGCTSCATCPLKGIGSPLKLAKKVPIPMGSLPSRSVQVISPEELFLPGEFVQDPTTKLIGFMVAAKKNKDDEAIGEDRFEPLFKHVIDVPWVNTAGLHFRMNTGADLRQVHVTDADMGTDTALSATLSKQMCHIHVPNQGRLRHFMTSWVAKIESERARMTTFPMGWIELDGETRGFSYAGNAYYDDGRIEPAGVPDKALIQDYTPVGKEKWILQAFKVVCDQHHPALEVLIAAGFASPLMKITGEDASVLWAVGESAAHKSTSILCGAGIWGNPRRTKDNTTASIVGLQSKLSNIRNLPAFIDEVQHIPQLEALMPQLNIITEGVGGPKSNRDGSSRARKEWQLLLTCGSNQSMVKYVRQKVKGTDATLRRIFEIVVEKRGDTATGVRQLTDKLNSNFGSLGVKYAQYLGLHHAKIMERGREIENEFAKEVDYRSEDRFWMTTCVAILTGAEVANLILPEPMFHVDEIKAFLKAEYLRQRAFIEKTYVKPMSKDGGLDLMSAFLKGNIDNQAWSWDMPPARGRANLSPVRGAPENRANPVHIHWYVIPKIVRISVESIETWVYKNRETISIQASEVVESIKKTFDAVDHRRKNLAAGLSGKGQTQERTLEISIDMNSPLYDTLMGPVGDQKPPEGLKESFLAVYNADLMKRAQQDAAYDAALAADVTAAETQTTDTSPETPPDTPVSASTDQ